MDAASQIRENYRNIDSENLYQVIEDFPGQVKEACDIGETAPSFKQDKAPSKIALLGMGGSAIGGDLIRSYCLATPGADHLQIHINRNYTLPGFIDKDTFVIASSYSGGTEETLGSFDDAMKITDRLLAISSGGELTEKCRQNNIPLITIPGGYQPRAALGYSFFPLLHLMMKSVAMKENAVIETKNALSELHSTLKDMSEKFSDIDPGNPAIELAVKLNGKFPVIYSSSNGLDTVNMRWRGQIQENAKNAAFGNYLPEMNHNEINGWTFPDGFTDKAVAIFLQDPDDHPRVSLRFDALKSVLGEKGAEVINISGNGKHFLTRMFELIYLADWVSYYLAILNKTDPTPIPLINRLKSYLAEN